MKVCCVLLAAGSSQRFGQDKLWCKLDGEPLWLKSYRVLSTHPSIDAVGLVCAAGQEESFRRLAEDALFVVPGATTRQDSARSGVSKVPEDFEIVLVHDAARPYVTREVIDRVIVGIQESGSACCAVPVTDTVRHNSPAGWVALDRSQLVATQTPQGALRTFLLDAYARATGQFTDEASLLESVGIRVHTVAGDTANIKVTHQSDLPSLSTKATRVGFGYDVHRFSTDRERPMWLGGVEFEERPGLEGHSDADVLIHAVVDALLGAASLGDIGVLYPNTEERWRDVPSKLFLRETVERLSAEGWMVVNIDATVIGERPKVMPKAMEIRETLAATIGCPIHCVSVKATTNEGLGALGRQEGVAAHAIALIETKKWGQ
ncbi:MAG: 2-C-methyl-D-erythritol 2,4-cyclodiphosphate synthase [Chthonomonadaceae bacterium]|nr:2-C-methyl-D-erythritol 2,4-cyclodiphosphate synthase [Chthonomonadaceae bacterium]